MIYNQFALVLLILVAPVLVYSQGLDTALAGKVLRLDISLSLNPTYPQILSSSDFIEFPSVRNPPFQWFDTTARGVSALSGRVYGIFKQSPEELDFELHINWRTSKITYLRMEFYTRLRTSADPDELQGQLVVRDLPLWSDGESLILDVPSSLFHTTHVSAKYRYYYTEHHQAVINEHSTDIDANSSRIRLQFGKPSILGAKHNVTAVQTLNACINPEAHVAMFQFAPSSVMRTMQVYNTLGACVKEILIQPKASSEEIAFHSLPTGHYTARLGNEAHSFAVWR